MPGILSTDQPAQTAGEEAQCPVAEATDVLKTAPATASGSVSPITRTPSPAGNGKDSTSDSGDFVVLELRCMGVLVV